MIENKRILIINSPTMDKGGFSGSPTSLLYAIGPLVEEIKARPKKINICGFSHLNIFDPVHYSPDTDEQLVAKLLQIEPHIVAISTTSDSLHIAEKMAQIVKAEGYRDSTIVILGGPHCDEVDFDAEDDPNNPLLASNSFDFVISGDGEYILLALVRTILEGMQKLKGQGEEISANGIRDYVSNNARSFARVKGQAKLHFKVNQQIKHVASSMDELNLNKLPPLRYEFLRKEHLKDFGIFQDETTKLTKNCVQVITHRGCRGYCSFCSERVISYDQRGRYYNTTKTVEKVIEEIWHYVHKVGAQAVFFDDSTFIEEPAFVKALCDQMIASGLSERIKWGCLNRFDKVLDPKLIEHMAQAGMDYMYLGLELFDDEALREMNKVKNRVGPLDLSMTEVIRNSLKMLSDNGVRVGVSILLGLPKAFEDIEIETIKFVGQMVDEKKIYLVSLSLFSYHLASLLAQSQRQRMRLDYFDVKDRMPKQNTHPWNCFEEGDCVHTVDRLIDETYLARLLWNVDQYIKVKDALVRKAELEEFIKTAWCHRLTESPSVFSLIQSLTNITLSDFVVLGNYVRYDKAEREHLTHICQRILNGFSEPRQNPQHWLFWGPTGSGKTSLIDKEIGKEAKARGVTYRQLDLSDKKMTEESFVSELTELEEAGGNALCFVDEIQAKPDKRWPFVTIKSSLDVIKRNNLPMTFVFAGSSGSDISELRRLIGSPPYHMGSDMLDRIPNNCSIPIMSFGDRIIVALFNTRQAGKQTEKEIDAVDKAALYYIALNPRLESARQIDNFVTSAVGRMTSKENSLKYDHLFDPENQESMQFCNDERHKGYMTKLSEDYVSITD